MLDNPIPGLPVAPLRSIFRVAAVQVSLGSDSPRARPTSCGSSVPHDVVAGSFPWCRCPLTRRAALATLSHDHAAHGARRGVIQSSCRFTRTAPACRRDAISPYKNPNGWRYGTQARSFATWCCNGEPRDTRHSTFPSRCLAAGTRPPRPSAAPSIAKVLAWFQVKSFPRETRRK
jgi:hypothetical protein